MSRYEIQLHIKNRYNATYIDRFPTVIDLVRRIHHSDSSGRQMSTRHVFTWVIAKIAPSAGLPLGPDFPFPRSRSRFAVLHTYKMTPSLLLPSHHPSIWRH